jgi:TIR domain/Tetratricopeptide repeat
MAQAADFFVSYTSPDRAWAEWIACQLEAEGYTVVVQAWDFTAGRDWAHEMQHATSTAERVVAVLSAAYLRSAHGEAEWRVFYAQDPGGERGLLLPVRVDKIDPPGLLKTRIYVDLVDQGPHGARAALLAAARGVRGKPTQEPEFPGDQRSAGSATEAPRFPGELPPIWNVPYHPNPYFTGRDLLLAEICARVTAPEADRRRVVLTGLGGIGKTQLAVEYAYRQRADYDLVWWLRSEQPTSLLSDYAALAEQPPLAADFRLPEDAPQEAAASAVRVWLERHRRWLLVFDNVDEPQAVAELLPRSGTGHVLLTTQAETGWEPLASLLPVEVLAATDAAGVLLTRTKERGPEAQAAATTLATTLGGLPLALEQAAAYIAASGTVTLAGYVELFATRALELLTRGQPLGYQHTVATTWSLALQTLQQTEPAAVDLLTLAAFLAPDDLPQPLLVTHHDQVPEPLATCVSDPLAFGDTVSSLRRYSLIRVIGDGLFVHRLLQTVVRAGLDDESKRAWASAAIRLLRACFPYPSDETPRWIKCQRLLPHALAALDHGERLTIEVEPYKRISLLHGAAICLWARGQYRETEPMLQSVVRGYKESLGSDHPDTLRSMNHLAINRGDLGDLQGARELHRQVLAARRRILGNEHPDTLDSINDLAEATRDLGDSRGARELHEEGLALRRRVLGDDNPSTLVSINNLAEVTRELGDIQRARELHEECLANSRRILGEDHPLTLASMHNVSLVHVALGDLHGARELEEQVLANCRRVLGDDHPNTLRVMGHLARMRADLGDLQAAQKLHEQVLASLRRTLGDENSQTLWSMHDLAETRRAQGELQEAYDLHERTLAARQRVLGIDHPDTLTSMNSLAEARRDLGDIRGARDLHEETLAARQRVLSDNHPDTQQSMKNVAEARRDLGEL